MSNDTTTQDAAAPAADQKVDQNSEIELTLQDLASLKNIIDVASARGAFRPNEMVSVGQVYSKLESFLKAVENQKTE